MSLSLTQDDNTALFRKAWTLYDAISEKNYMFHREIYDHVSGVLQERHAQGPYHLLDLGCGNARFLAPCLKLAPPASYDGVDLSVSALDEARTNLKGIANTGLHHKDMLQAVENADTAFDIIFSGFAVHHLDAADKQRLFTACAEHLAPGGQFILVDVVREDGQTREQYLDGYLNFMRTQWTEVQPEHLDEACSHVSAYDFPETLADLTQMAKQAGLSQPLVLNRFSQHHVMVFLS
ncbi:class I SAM-dependent methyltransferase [Prosthecobacter sp.]|jgi:SAM-dependent methyltransferase|uniref:class I SAM-dependent methyltransferase n=1 Tax=Prosthecobacter sp. TaxID=1965333 RepID=UPI0037C8D982